MLILIVLVVLFERWVVVHGGNVDISIEADIVLSVVPPEIDFNNFRCES
jgi:hypothetical protein